MIKAEQIIKSFKSGDTRVTILRGISFEVRKGEFVSIIGRSGSGKTTLLYQLGLLDRPTSGKIFIDSFDVTSLTEQERTAMRLSEFGYVFQDYALVPELSAIENVMAPLLMQGMSRHEAKTKAVQALHRVGLPSRVNNLPNQLSGGEQQRVSIARAIAHNPKILFADEPTANLDHETSLAILDAFHELHRAGQTIVMVTHELDYAEQTDRIVTLFDGQVTEDKRLTTNN
ncbi:MAG: ABC transporter [Candidatus Harrisonbacteria bacterium CG10_big_fil_rev_8_21_14_0_10_40_38]|uniref:ABC transporter n=1 Tax=Candidatus Harrisonbacteria bacterium CG10_big_fil_rev_8_21_14_0_10_40_38 TaxID=1974583 RepID=A0A2H0URV1_9BACT|nr:MAG: ABC transporter [Candidatus Harrisonbacteria bacterium CG10_big_fil_rev_8_21_14_0_10_40_38]